MKRRRRTYPFTESVPMTAATSANSTPIVLTNVRMTIYKTNPFTGIDRLIFATDEWGHRNLSHRWHRILFGRLCDWWDRRVL